MISTPTGTGLRPAVQQQAAGHASTAARSDTLAASKRLFYLDNLRIGLVMLVIAHHVGQAYGPTGGSWPIMEQARDGLLGSFFTVNRSFFMSLFFMISGYFTVMSFEGSGAGGFVKSRLQRLGTPLLWWGLLVMVPIQVFAFQAPAWPIDIGHLWFVEHLLVFSLVYALWRVIRDRRGHAGVAKAEGAQLNPPGVLAVLGLALGIALVSGIVRIWYPIDRWVILLGFFKVMWADVPRDLAFFIIGLIAYRNDWFARFPTRAGMAWLGAGVAASLFWTAHQQWGLGSFLIPYDSLAEDLVYLIWEGVLVCSMCIGLTVLFREKLNIGGRLARAMGKGQYAAYIWHVPIVLACQAAVLALPLPPLVKFILVTVAAIPLTFAFAALVRKPLRL